MAEGLIHIQLLGHPRVMIGDLELGGAAARPKALLFLACLALAGPDGVNRARLKRLFWPTSDPEAARISLKQLLYLLRKDTGQPDLFVSNGGVALNTAIVQTDVWEFSNALGEGDVARALTLFQTGLVAGASTDVPALAGWLADERQALRARLDAALAMALTGDRIRLDGGEAVELWIQGASYGFDVSRSAQALADWIASDAGSALRPRLPELTQAALRIEQQHEAAAGTAAVFQRVAIACGAVASTTADVPKDVSSSASVRPRPVRRRRIIQAVAALAVASVALAAISPVRQAVTRQLHRRTIVVDRFDCAGPDGRKAGDPWLAVITGEALRAADELGVHVTVGGDPGTSDLRVAATCATLGNDTELRFTIEVGAQHQVVRMLTPVTITDPAADVTRAVDRLVGAVGIEVDPALAVWKGSTAGDADLTTWKLLAAELDAETALTGPLVRVAMRRAMAHDSSSPIVRLVATGFTGMPYAGYAMGRFSFLAPDYRELEPERVRSLITNTERDFAGTHWASELQWSSTDRPGWLTRRYDSLDRYQQHWIADLAAATIEHAKTVDDSSSALYPILGGLRQAQYVSGTVSVMADENFSWLQSRADTLPPMEQAWVALAVGFPFEDSVTTLMDLAHRVLRASPALPAARRWMAEAYLLAGLPDSAMATLNGNRTALTPMNDRTELTLAFETMMAEGQFDQALHLIDNFIGDEVPQRSIWRRFGEALDLVKRQVPDEAERSWLWQRSSEAGPMYDLFFVICRARALRALGRLEEARRTLTDQLSQTAMDSTYIASDLLGAPLQLPDLGRLDSIAARDVRRRRDDFHRNSYQEQGDAYSRVTPAHEYWQLSRRLEDDPRLTDFTFSPDRYVVRLLESGDPRTACSELDSANAFLRSQVEYQLLALDVRAACGDDSGFTRAMIALRGLTWPGRPGLVAYYVALAEAAIGKCEEASLTLAAAFEVGLPFQPSRFRLPEWGQCLGNKHLAGVIPSKEFGAPR